MWIWNSKQKAIHEFKEMIGALGDTGALEYNYNTAI